MKDMRICGVRIDNITTNQAIERSLVRRAEGPCVVFTPNAVMLDACRENPELCRVMAHATLSLPDGAGVLYAAYRKGSPLQERVTGIAFGEGLLKECARRGFRVFLLGGKKGVAQRAAEHLIRRYHGLVIAGTENGYFPKTREGSAQVLAQIQKSRADILLVCLGFPMQETWIVQHLSRLSHLRVIAALGGSLDVWSGEVRRAPRLLQRTGLEWAWRTLAEPRRVGRLPALARFALLGGGDPKK